MQRSSRDNRGRNWSSDNDIVSFHEPARRCGSCVNRSVADSHESSASRRGRGWNKRGWLSPLPFLRNVKVERRDLGVTRAQFPTCRVSHLSGIMNIKGKFSMNPLPPHHSITRFLCCDYAVMNGQSHGGWVMIEYYRKDVLNTANRGLRRLGN